MGSTEKRMIVRTVVCQSRHEKRKEWKMEAGSGWHCYVEHADELSDARMKTYWHRVIFSLLSLYDTLYGHTIDSRNTSWTIDPDLNVEQEQDDKDTSNMETNCWT